MIEYGQLILGLLGGYTGRNLPVRVEIKSYYVITREILAHKSIYDHLIRMATVDEIVNVNVSNGQQKAKT